MAVCDDIKQKLETTRMNHSGVKKRNLTKFATSQSLDEGGLHPSKKFKAFHISDSD